MAKKRLNKHHRAAIYNWMVKEKVDTEERFSKLKDLVVDLAVLVNKPLRDKYPEKDMVVLRKYDLVRKDMCLKFNIPETNQVFGVNMAAWGMDSKLREVFKEVLVDIPIGTGCHNSEIFVGSEELRDLWDRFELEYSEVQSEIRGKKAKYSSFLDNCKTLEDVEEIVPLPEHIRVRVLGSNACVTIMNPELVNSIKDDFTNG